MKFIRFLKTYQADIILAVTVILISITSFNLGKISVLNNTKAQLTITEPEAADKSTITTGGDTQEQGTTSKNTETTNVFASKKSTGKLYHFPWCPGASKIAEKNKLTFATETTAISAGYTLASNCTR